jgi:hypothetical protein
MLTIAGIISPWKEDDIACWLGNLREEVSDDEQQQVDALGKIMIAMTHGLGDGLVTVKSTRLEGVLHRTVEGNHLSMIRNISKGSRRIPPAVLVIVDRLKKAQ